MNKAKTLIHHHIEHYIRQEKLIRRFKDQEGRNNSYNWHGPQHGPNRDWGGWGMPPLICTWLSSGVPTPFRARSTHSLLSSIT
jgi:hypothetical protein